MQFVDVKNDVAFRKIFGNENKKVILISFLNAVLGLEGRNRVQEVTLLNPFQLPRVIGEKASVIDVRAKDEKGITFIIEMQVPERDGFDKRVLYYSGKDYSAQIKSGDDYPLLRPVYFIGILDFNYFLGENYLSTHLILDESTGENAFKDLKFRFIELKKFNKNADELESVIDKWTFFIKNARNLDVIPENLKDPGLEAAYQEAAQHNWTREAYDAYIYSGMRDQDLKGEISFAVRKAEEIGEKRGEKRGEEKKQNALILAMHAKGLSLSMIGEITRLDEAEILQIIENQ